MKDVIRSSKANIVLIQKSKLSSMSDLLIKEVCGSASFDWICLDALGSSRGIILCCNRRALVIKDRWIEDFSVSALVMDLASNCTWIITFVMAQMTSLRRNFWSELDSIRNRRRGPWCLGGDWNVIRYPTEKSSGSQITSDMLSFTDWINSQSLVDLPLGGTTFTWSNHQSSPTLSCLDRFLVSNDWLNLFSKAS